MNTFSDQSPKAIEIRAKINPWNLIKLKSFCTAKESQKKTKRHLREWEKIVPNDATDKGIISSMTGLNCKSGDASVAQWANQWAND